MDSLYFIYDVNIQIDGEKMKKIRIGILGAADIAYRRFLPALKKIDNFEFIGVAIADYYEWNEGYDKISYELLLTKKKEKAQKFIDCYGGKIFVGYENMLRSQEIDAVYVPLPPSLHYYWCYKALSLGKHVLAEKPCTTNLKNTMELVDLAKQKGLVINENYAFCMHKQIQRIKELIEGETVGEVRLLRSAFGFPHRAETDFRYKRKMGGGALLDCGGYVLKIAQLFLKDDIRVLTSIMHNTEKHDVDVFGSAVLIDQSNTEAQIAFGMDNSYKCELEIWGSKASIFAPRIFTPPAELETKIIIKGQNEEIVTVEPDDQFIHAIEFFYTCMIDGEKREAAEKEIVAQSKLVEEVREKNSFFYY